MPDTLLVDYGEVISEPQPAELVAEMASLIGLDVPEFSERYWRLRPDYDRGEPAASYWSKMNGGDPVDAGTLEQLIRLDIDSWCVFNPSTLELLMDAQRAGRSLSVLSNAPHELGARLNNHPTLAFFEHLIFSAWIGAVKPEPEAFDAAIRKLGKEPGEILFVDDREANVKGAIDVGLQAVQFTSVEGLRAALSL